MSVDAPYTAWRSGGTGGDVLMLARQLTCTTKGSIGALFEHLQPPPRLVHLVLARPSGCSAAPLFAPPGRLKCYDEARVLPVSKEALARLYERMPDSPELPASNRAARRRLRDPSRVGWYFQQFVKLGFPLFNRISPDFLIWDADAVLIQPFAPIGPGGELRLVTGGYSNMPQYDATFRTLFNATLQYSPDRTSLVTHHALVHTPWLIELVARLSLGRACAGEAQCAAAARDPQRWMTAVLRATRGLKSFSEYAFYLSWQLLRHADELRGVAYLGRDECGVYAAPLPPGQSLKCHRRPARAFCRNPLLTESTICPGAYRELYRFERERALSGGSVLFVNFETHAWGKDPLENATGAQLAAEIDAREAAHVRQASGPQQSRVLKRPRPCTPW
tara:strand:- start:274 stop:1446 length:1173 start_codon:yes stop_codon:yes gene_type:complete